MKRGTKEHAAASKPKRKLGQIEADRVFIGELYSKGNSHQAITDALNAARPYSLSRTTVAEQVHSIIDEWRLWTVTNADIKIAEELIRLHKIESEAWSAWERSKTEETRRTSEKTEGKNGRSLARVIKSGRDGDPRFLTIVGNCITTRCKLLGLYAASKVQPEMPDGTPIAIPMLPAPTIRVVFEESPQTKERLALAHDGNGTKLTKSSSL